MWTLYACGLNPQSFAATEAAVVQNTYPDPDQFPKMIWATNYYRLAAATMFTMFFGGRDFTPKCIIDGMNIQDYLQSHFINTCAHVAKRIHEAGDLEDVLVVGWESMNEPNRGLLGHEDLSIIPEEQKLKKGTSPTTWQAILLGSGRAVEVETWDVGGLGPYKVGTTLVDPHGEIAWLPKGYDESRYGYKRDEAWKLGECIWAQHGVWDPKTDTLLKKDYFAKNPQGEILDYPKFTNTYFMDLYRGWRDAIRAQHKNSILLMQYPTLELPPEIAGSKDDDPKMGYSPHFYDGITLMTKKWNRTWNVDVVGVLRGKYLHPVFAIKIGEAAIRNCFKDQLSTLRQEGKDRIGKHPCCLTEFGIPYDMDDKAAYKTGDYSSQSAAFDANYFAVEGSMMEGHFAWTYMSKNDHSRGDQWNGEDLSIFSVDDKPLPMSPLPKGLEVTTSIVEGSTATLVKQGSGVNETTVTPENLKRTLTTPSIRSEPSIAPELTNAPGYRAAEAFVRPTPVAVAGIIKEYGFNLRSCVFNLKVEASEHTTEDAPTIVFLPDYHFPQDASAVQVSSGKWEISSDDEDGPVMQRLRWWHGAGEQTLKITGVVRKHNILEGTAEEWGYLQQCQQTYGITPQNCDIM